LTGVYQRFISGYQIIIEPLRRLKKKDTPFIFGPDQHQAFITLRKQLSLLPTLRQPDFTRQFELHTDAATKAGIAVILCQRHDGHPYPLSFASRSLNKHEQNYAVQELEALAIVWGIKKFRPYLERNKFLVFTDHSSLQWILNTKIDRQPRLWRWCMFLQAYDFDVIYVPGPQNQAADALSRHPLPDVHSLDGASLKISSLFNWLDEQAKDEKIMQIKNQIETQPYFFVRSNLLYHVKPAPRNKSKNLLLLVVPSHLVQEIITLYHESTFSGHSGIKKTLARLRQAKLWWSSIDTDVRKAIIRCRHCQQMKGTPATNYDMDNTAASLPFNKVAMDYWGPLPETAAGYRYVLVVIDTCTRYVELYPSKSNTAMELASTFYHGFILRHGIPHEVLSDNGSPFNSLFLGQLATFINMDLKYTPPYHPQSNGLVERFMSTLRKLVITFLEKEDRSTRWDRHLRLIRFVYNNTYHSAILNTPFFLAHGRHARTPLDPSTLGDLPPLYKGNPTPQSQLATDLQHNLQEAMEAVWTNLYSHDSPLPRVKYELGDQVWFYNYKRSTSKYFRKLHYDWVGPYEITAKLSDTTYSLLDRDTGKSITNIHVSSIKPAIQ
jgi:transposase InsO family protein